MMLKLAAERWSWKQLLRQRLFATREREPRSSLALYRREWTKGSPRHTARHDF